MAIDTAEKRRSVAGVGLVIFGPAVTPTVGKDQEWRQQSAWSYSGILAESPVAADPAEFFRIPSIPRLATIPSVGLVI
jgi:hypothetical protein